MVVRALPGQIDMFGQPAAYPETPGARRRDTSEDAAAAVAKRAPTLRALCLQAIVDANHIGGLTADEVAAQLRRHVLSIRPRICELNALGRVADSGMRRTNASGKRAIVWRAS